MMVVAENNPKLHLDADYCKCVPSAFVLPLAAVYVRGSSTTCDRAFALEPRIGFHFTVKVVSRGFLIWPWWPFFQSLQRAIERQVADRKRPDQYSSFH